MNRESFQIIKQTDRQLFNALDRVIEDGPYSSAKFTVMLTTDKEFVFDGSKLTDWDELTPYINLDSELVRTLVAKFPEGPTLTCTRQPGKNLDQLSLEPGNEQDSLRWGRLIAVTRRRFRAADAAGVLAQFLEKDLAEHYRTREEQLGRLEDLTHTLIRDTDRYRKQLDSEHDAEKVKLEEQFEQRHAKLDEEFTSMKSQLKTHEENLATRLQEVDDRESRHVRRELRERLKEEIKNRSVRFELTRGTCRMRRTVYWFSILLMAVLGFASALFAYDAFELIRGDSNTTTLILVLARQLGFSLAFGATAVFFIRWNDRWFEQHAKEEFQLKRFDLDIDRASWLVEMLMEWRKETKAEVPDYLIERLAHNLFMSGPDQPTRLHPSEDIASLLLGASNRLKLKTPIGAEFELNRKGIRSVLKEADEEQD